MTNHESSSAGPEMKREYIMTETEAKDFVSHAIFKVNSESNALCCVDGRYTPEQTEGTAMAGGAAGLLGAALAAGNELESRRGITIPKEQIRDAVFATVGGKEKFAYHSDTHHGLNGCGHNARCISRPKEYGLTEEQSEFVKQTLENLQSSGIKPVELHGDHEEAAVIIVKLPGWDAENPETYSLYHQADVNGKNTQAFVYTETLVDQTLKKLAGEIAKTANTPADEIYNILKEKESLQRDITVKELALDKGKPVFEVAINSKGEISGINKVA